MIRGEKEKLLTETLRVLGLHAAPLSIARLRKYSDPLQILPEKEIKKALDEFVREGELAKIVTGELERYCDAGSADLFYTPVDKSEKTMYEPFCSLLRKSGETARYFDHTAALKKEKGKNLWSYPDIISRRKVLNGNEPEQSVEIVSYELKKRIGSNAREVFFQTLANSFWANRAYAVAPSISNFAMNTFTALSRKFPVGLIGLKLASPSADPDEMIGYSILLECPYSRLDSEAFANLRKDWPALDAWFGDFQNS